MTTTTTTVEPMTDAELAELVAAARAAKEELGPRGKWPASAGAAPDHETVMSFEIAVTPAAILALAARCEAERADAERLRAAFLDVLDGNSAWWEIHENTGLPQGRCEEIAAMYAAARALAATPDADGAGQ